MSDVYSQIPFFAELKCTLCGREGKWPYIAFDGTDHLISHRPNDVAAVVVVKGRCPRVLTYENIVQFGGPHDVYCPHCYRLGATARDNDFNDAFPDISAVDVAQILNTPVHGSGGMRPYELIEDAFDGAAKDSFYGVEYWRDRRGEMLGGHRSVTQNTFFRYDIDKKQNIHVDIHLHINASDCGNKPALFTTSVECLMEDGINVSTKHIQLESTILPPLVAIDIYEVIFNFYHYFALRLREHQCNRTIAA